eukprot:4029927-Pleurochrysis_carterae.AAC.2
MKDDFVAKTESVDHDDVHSVEASKGMEDEVGSLVAQFSPGTTCSLIDCLGRQSQVQRSSWHVQML